MSAYQRFRFPPMAASYVDPKVVSAILDAVGHHADGATLADIMASFPKPPSRRSAQRWVSQMVSDGQLRADMTVAPYRYYVADDVAMANPVAARVAKPRSVATDAAVAKPVGPVATVPSAIGQASSPPPVAMAKPHAVDAPVATSAHVAHPRSVATNAPVAKPIGHVATLPSATGHALSPLPTTSVAMAKPGKPAVANSAPARTPRASRSGQRPKSAPTLANPSLDDVLTPLVAAAAAVATGDVASLRESVATTGKTSSGDRRGQAATGGHRSLLMVGFGLVATVVLPLLTGRPWLAISLATGVAAIWLAMATFRRPTASVASAGAGHDSPSGVIWPRLLLATVLLIIAGGALYLDSLRYPSKAAISEYIRAQLPPTPLQVAELDPTYVRTSSSDCQVIYHALIEPSEPLYQRLETTEYLRTKMPREMAVIDAANALLSGPNRFRILAGVAASPPEPNLSILVLLEAQLPLNRPVPITGTLTGWRHGLGWTLTGEVPFDRKRWDGEIWPAGLFRRGQEPAVFVVGAPDDDRRLEQLVRDHAAYAEKVKKTNADLLSAEH